MVLLSLSWARLGKVISLPWPHGLGNWPHGIVILIIGEPFLYIGLMVVLGGVKGRGKVRQICCIEKCVFCSSPKNFLLFSLTLLFILKQSPIIRGPGEHYTVQ